MVAPTPLLNLIFISLVVLLYSCLFVSLHWGNNLYRIATHKPSSFPIKLRLILMGWLMLTGSLAFYGWLSENQSFPPHMFAVLVPAIIGVAWLSLSKSFWQLIHPVAQHWIVLLQSFRVLMEVLLLYMWKAGLVAQMMTFEGANFDILVGITAPIVAFLAYKFGPRMKRTLIIWNIFGIIALTNVVVRGLLAAPTSMQMIFVEPANTAVFYFPFVWLPAFVVPMAYLLHIISLKKLRQQG